MKSLAVFLLVIIDVVTCCGILYLLTRAADPISAVGLILVPALIAGAATRALRCLTAPGEDSPARHSDHTKGAGYPRIA